MVSFSSYSANNWKRGWNFCSPSIVSGRIKIRCHDETWYGYCKVVSHINGNQTPVIAFDQPLYAIAKQVQWNCKDNYREEHFLVMMGALHIEIEALKTLGISFFFKQFDPFNIHDNCNNGFVTVHSMYNCGYWTDEKPMLLHRK